MKEKPPVVWESGLEIAPVYGPEEVEQSGGWEGVGRELHRLSRTGGWKEMPNQISDEMLDEWAIVGTQDELVKRVRERCTGVFSTILLDLSPELRRDEDWLQETVEALQRA